MRPVRGDACADVAIVHRGEIRKYGPCNQVITEHTLKDIYDVDVRIHSVPGNGKSPFHKICMPLIQ
ncbi:MAG: hypothetical protein LBQ39_00780 [Tannerellaceae bacterium]|nr:hypothetical protein [Tannerellaceae bacterium]